MTFAAIITFGSDLSRITEIRPAHRENLLRLREAGNLALAGAFTDLRGGMIVYQAESEDEVQKMLENDPYTKAGIFASWEIRPWNIVVSRRDLLPE